MASDSIFTPASDGRIWMDLISKSLNQDLEIQIDTPPSIFLLPTTITEEKPEAYTPQQIGLGPYHHLRLEFYQMERQKLAAVRGFLEPVPNLKFQQLVLCKLKEIEPTIRGCYDKYLDLDGETLLWTLAIDGLFLLQHLVPYSKERTQVDEAAMKLRQDIIMLETQIPFVVLETIRAALQLLYDDGAYVGHDNVAALLVAHDNHGASSSENNNKLFELYHAFCDQHSPLKLTHLHVFLKVHGQEIHHLLDFMYHSIVNNRGISNLKGRIGIHQLTSPLENGKKIIDIMASQGNVHALALQRLINFLTQLKEKVLPLIGFKKSDEQKTTKEEINIASVSELCKTAKMKFQPVKGGIKDIRVVEDTRIFGLPKITLNVD